MLSPLGLAATAAPILENRQPGLIFDRIRVAGLPRFRDWGSNPIRAAGTWRGERCTFALRPLGAVMSMLAAGQRACNSTRRALADRRRSAALTATEAVAVFSAFVRQRETEVASHLQRAGGLQ